MKVFKLARAELKKIFLRPIMFVVFLTLLISIALLSMNFNPEPRTVTAVSLNRTGETIQSAYNKYFLAETSETSKKKFDDILIKEYNAIDNFFANFDTSAETGQLKILSDRIANVDSAIDSIYYHNLNYNSNRTQANRNAVVNAFAHTSNELTAVRAYIQNIEGSLNFFIKESDLTTLKDFFRNMQANIPENFPITGNDVEIFESNLNYLKKYDFAGIVEIVDSLEYFDIDTESFDVVIEKYYTDILDPTNINNTSPALNSLFDQIKDFRQQNAESSDEEHFVQLETYISQYKSISNMASIILKNEFALSKAGTKVDEEMQQYVGFTNYSSYELRQNANLYKYLLENNLFDYDFLTPFSYNTNSGQESNAFDFVIYSMQAISFIIAIFAIFIASGTVANEQNIGTMKMLAIRPYSRSKIITAKLFSVIKFMLLMLIISFVSTFAVGYFSYGVTQTQSLLVFNAENVFILNSFLALGLYFVSLFLNMTFYITIALMISVMARSSTVAIILSILIYGLSLFGNLFFFKAPWFVYLPIAHLDIFRFFGSKANTGNLFNFTFPLNSNFFVSLIYLGSTLLISYLLTISIFKKRNIA